MPLVDSTTVDFLTQLKQRYAHFGAWLQYHAFDVKCELTYLKWMGFIDSVQGVEQIISNLGWLLNYAAVASFD
jgi:hypothetical protein